MIGNQDTHKKSRVNWSGWPNSLSRRVGRPKNYKWGMTTLI